MPERTGPPFRLKGLDHVLLLVSDAGRTTRFYVDVLGCSVETELAEYGMVELRAGESMIGLVDIGRSEGAWAQPAVRGGRNVEHFCLSLAAVEESEVRGHFRKHGVRIVDEAVHADAGGESLSLYVEDPEGNRIELILTTAPD